MRRRESSRRWPARAGGRLQGDQGDGSDGRGSVAARVRRPAPTLPGGAALTLPDILPDVTADEIASAFLTVRGVTGMTGAGDRMTGIRPLEVCV